MTRKPVLLIHGIHDTGARFAWMRSQLESKGWEAHCPDLTPNDGVIGLDRLATQIASYVQVNFAPDRRFDLVGFSMGGLVSRYYLQRLGGLERVRRFVSISCPHRGTWTAFLRSNAGTRQMRPGSLFLRDLNHDAEILDRVCLTSIWTPFDLMILPASSSVTRFGRSVRVSVPAHVLMLKSRQVLRAVLESLTLEHPIESELR